MLITKKHSQRKPVSSEKIWIINQPGGFTIAEILIALVLNSLILLALISVFSNNVSHVNKSIHSDTLNQQLESAMQLMANDIRRAGYWGNAQSDVGTGVNSNPFMAASTDLSINGSNNCILFSYDYNSDGSIPAISNAYDDERYGFRLNNQTLQSRPPGAAFNCTAAASAWENVTNPGIVNITSLTFTLNSSTIPVGAATKTLLIRSVVISITGQLVSDATVTKTLTQHVRILNDKYVP
jgi:prepilin peptidase dependent protein B